MRLIDADAEIEKISEEMTRAMAEIARWERRKTDADTTLYDIEAKIVQLQKNIVDCNKEIKILRLYNTAYDVDKIIKQLERRSVLSRPVGWTKSYEIVTLKDAIEIVKDGGVEK